MGSLTSRDQTNSALFGSSQKDQYFKDCTFQLVKNPVTGKTTVWVSGRNDFAVSAVPSGGSGEGTAIHVWRGHSESLQTPPTLHVLTAFGTTNSTLYDNNTSLGAITGRCEFISETAISGVATAVFVSRTGNKAYYYAEGGSLTEITDSDFPAKNGRTITGNFAHMDGFAFIMATNGEIWHSDVNSLANWTSTSSISAQEYPDGGVGLIRYRNYIVGAGVTSIEFFVNSGNATGAVLSRVQNMALNIGCANHASLCSFSDTFFWVGIANGSYGVYMMNGGNAAKVSTTEIDEALTGIVRTACRLNLMYSWGKSYLVLHIATADDIYVYDPETRIWMQWVMGDKMFQSDAPGGAEAGMYYVGSDQTTYLSSNDSVVSGEVQFGPIDFDTNNWKRCNSIKLVGDKASQTCNVAVSWSDNDGQSYSTPRNIDMASTNPQITRCGMFRRRMFKLTGIGEAANDRRLRLEAVELDIEGASL